MATRRFNQQTNVLTSDLTNALDRNTGVGVSKRLSEVIAQAYTRDYYKFQSNTFFALVIGQTENRSTDIRTARHTFSELEYQRESQGNPNPPEKPLYPSCKVRILETGHSFLGDPTDPDGVFRFNRNDPYADSAIAKKLRALNIAYVDMHGFPAYSKSGEYPEYGDVVLVEVDNISDPRDIKILEIVAKKIIEPLDFSGGAEIDPPAPGGNSGILGPARDALAAATGPLAVYKDPTTGELKLVRDQFQEFSASNSNPYPNISLGSSVGVRRYAVQLQLLNKLQSAAAASNATLKIRSAGQPNVELVLSNTGTYPIENGKSPDGDGTYRTGSVRHNFGWAVDVELYSNNSNRGEIRIATGVETASTELSNFLSNAYREGITAIGAGPGYMTGDGIGLIHLDIADNNILEQGDTGFGANYWGEKNRAANAPSWLRDAYENAQSANTPVAASTSTEPQEGEDDSRPV